MILEQIRQVYPQLTKSQKKLADFISHSYREAAFMTASRMADRLSLNEATVIRFAQRLGYSGYPELIKDVQSLVQEELIPSPPEDQEVKDPFLALLATEMDHAQRFISHLAPELAHEVINVLSQADRVYVLGQGVAAPLAQLLGYCLRSVGVVAESPQSDPNWLAMVTSEVNTHCVIVGISAASESNQVANALRYAGQKGVRTIALTSSPISPCAQAADLALSCPMPDGLPLPSVTVIAILIDTLTQSLGSRNASAANARRADMDQARDYIVSTRR